MTQNLKIVWVTNGETVVHLDDDVNVDEHVGQNIAGWNMGSFSYSYEDLDAPPPEEPQE